MQTRPLTTGPARRPKKLPAKPGTLGTAEPVRHPTTTPGGTARLGVDAPIHYAKSGAVHIAYQVRGDVPTTGQGARPLRHVREADGSGPGLSMVRDLGAAPELRAGCRARVGRRGGHDPDGAGRGREPRALVDGSSTGFSQSRRGTRARRDEFTDRRPQRPGEHPAVDAGA